MLWVLVLVSLSFADEFSHTYEQGETVTVWFDNVGAASRPRKIHSYSWLPLCCGETPSNATHALTLSETIEGFEMQDSGMDVRFIEDVQKRHLCSVQVSPESLEQLRQAVTKEFELQLFVDDLPVWGPLGVIVAREDGEHEVFVHVHFKLLVHYNRHQIIQVLYEPETLVKLEKTEQSLDFSYSVTWIPTSISFESRFSLYENLQFPTTLYSFMFGCCFVVLVIVVLGIRLTFGRLTIYNEFIEDARPVTNTSGIVESDLGAFKQLAGQVFRAPSCLLLFTACTSAGVQLLAVTLVMLLLFQLYPVYMERTHRMSMLVTLYSLFSLLGGLRSGSFYQQHRGRYWVVNLLISLFTVPLLVGAVVLTLQAYSPVPPLLSETEGRVFLFLGVPLHIGGNFIGWKYLADPGFPCKVSTMQPPTRSPKRWYQHSLVIVVLSGYLPTFAMIWSIDALLSNVTEYRAFCSYGFGLGVILLLLCASACTGILVTHYLITLKDHRWPWVSFLSAGSPVVYILLVATDFYSKSTMNGWLPWSIYFGYIGLGCFDLFLLFGSMGHFAANCFMRYVYTNIKRL